MRERAVGSFCGITESVRDRENPEAERLGPGLDRGLRVGAREG